MRPFETTHAEISALSDVQLTQLLHRLLILEAQKIDLPKSKVSVALRITIADAGQDGRIEWTDGPEPAESDWIPNRTTLFQVKATYMSPADCGKELLAKKQKEDDPLRLKLQVQDVLDRGGAYVLIYYESCEGKMASERVKAFKKTIADVRGEPEALAADVRIYGSEKLATWTNEHAAAVAFVKFCLGRPIPAELQTWESWSEEHQSHLTFFADKARADLIEELRGKVSQAGSVIRLAGLSGLGKSRLALELFRPPTDISSDPEQAALNAACVYVSDGAMSAEALRAAMMEFRQNQVRAVIVVDECPLELHEKLEKVANAHGSKISLLTLDFDPASDPHSRACTFYRLEPYATEDVAAILRLSGAIVPTGQLEKVAEFAQGFPRMAELLADAIQSGQKNLWELAAPTLVQKLVARRSREPNRLIAVARSLAILEHLGVDGLVSEELVAFSERVCGMKPDEVYQTVRELEDAGIAYRRGDYVRITPLPIAVALAGDWWGGCSPERAEKLLLGGELPPALVDATANQLKRLSKHPWVQKLVARIYGVGSPFRQREPLNSALGSRLANSLAEVNPVVVCNALTAAFGSMSTEEARGIRAGRRDLVWCLEKLAWWPETFSDAAWMLLIFGEGENERWGNNATNQLGDLFHIYLGGTETPALERLGVLRRALATDEERFGPLVVRALGEALASGHFTRTGGPDAQGEGFTRADWKPKTYGEIWEYWRGAIELLEPYLQRESPEGAAARKAVGTRVRGVLLWGGIDIVESLVERFLRVRADWPEVLEGLRSALNYDGSDYPPALRARVERLIERLEPKTLEGRLKQIVSLPPWHELRREPDGSITQVAAQRARSLAAEVARDVEELTPHLPGLLTGEQRQASAFGRALASEVREPLTLLNGCLSALRDIAPEERNAALALGIASWRSESNKHDVRSLIRSLYEDEDLRAMAVELLQAVGPEAEDVERVAELVRTGKLRSTDVHGFVYGRAIDLVSSESVAHLVNACADSDNTGPLVALELLGMRLHGGQFDGVLVECGRSLLARPCTAQRLVEAPGGMGGHHFETLLEACIEGASDSFVSEVTALVLSSVGLESGFPMGQSFREALRTLLSRRPDESWPVLKTALGEAEGAGLLRIELTVNKFDLVDLIGEQRLLEWCDASPDAPRWVARMIDPLRGAMEGAAYPRWRDTAVEMLRRYGNEKDVQSALWASIYSGTWAGSAVPRLTEHRQAFEELKDFPEVAVAAWARATMDALDEEILEARKRDEEREFGIMR